MPTIFIILLSFLAHGEILKIKDSSLEFVAIGKPAMIKIVGESKDVTGTIDSDVNKGYSGTIQINLKSVTSGIEMRDEHMKEKYLEIGKFPTAVLKVQGISFLSSGQKLKKTFNLPLSLHGVEKNVDVDVDMANKSGAYEGVATFSVKLTDYNISIPTYLGIKVADKVEVKVNFKGAK